MPADLKRRHKYMVEIEHISVISDEVSAFGGIPDMRCRLALMACAAIDPNRT
jgi:hypothetical protein